MSRLTDLYALRDNVDDQIRAEVERIEAAVLAHRRRLDKLRGGRTYCGTDTGYKYHRRRRETACLACKAAHAQAERLRAARQRQRLIPTNQRSAS